MKHITYQALRFSSFLAVVCLISALLFGIWEWTDRNLEYVCTKIEKRHVEIHDGLSLLAMIVASPVVLPFNVGCEIYATCVDE